MRISIRRFLDETVYLQSLVEPGNGFSVMIPFGMEEYACQTIDQRLSGLGDRKCLTLGCEDVPPGFGGDAIMAHGPRWVHLIAMCYARALGRPFIDCDDPGWMSMTMPKPSSITFFLSQGGLAPQGWMKKIRASWPGATIPVGIMIGGGLRELCWLAVKQIFQLVEGVGGNRRTTVLPGPDADRFPELPCLDLISERSAGEVVRARLLAELGTIIINGHSRPHCGMVRASGVTIGICGSDSRESDSQCVIEGCSLNGSAKISMDRLKAKRIFYNGCATARLSNGYSHFPLNAQIGIAALRGSACNFIGNSSIGRYNEWDMFCLLGLSALGVRPASVVVAINHLRSIQDRQWHDSCYLFGDACSPAWPSIPVNAPEVVLSRRSVGITWTAGGNLRVARLIGSDWGRLAVERSVEVTTVGGASAVGAGRCVVLPGSDCGAYVIHVGARSDDDGGSVNIKIRVNRAKAYGKVRLRLARALDHVDVLKLTPTFSRIGQRLSSKLSRGLIDLHRYINDRNDQIDLRMKHSRAKRLDESLAASMDLRMVVRAAALIGTGRWDWERELMVSVRLQSAGEGVCPVCGGVSRRHLAASSIKGSIEWSVSDCAECGYRSNLPLGNLTAHLKGNGENAGNTYRDILVLHNEHGAMSRVTFSMVIQGMIRAPEVSASTSTVVVPPRGNLTIPLATRIEQTISGFHWIHVPICSYGAFGVLTRPYAFVRSINPSSTARVSE